MMSDDDGMILDDAFPVGVTANDVNTDTNKVFSKGEEPFETCPWCDSEPGYVSRQLAPNQLDCTNDDCPVDIWNKHLSSG